MTQSLAFTCLMPVWRGDRPADFSAALDTVFASTRPPDDLVLCEDGDLGPELEVIAARAEFYHGARRVRNPGPHGLHHNLNFALRQVRTPWVARADADDLNALDRFALQTAWLEAHPDIGVLGGDLIEFWPDGRTRHKTMPTTHADIAHWARWRSPVNHNTVFYRTEDVLTCGGYPDIPLKEDYGLWLKLLASGVRFANLRADLVRARMGETFYERRAGLKNLSSEWSLHRLKQSSEALRGPTATVAFVARAAALATAPLTKTVYDLGLRH